MGRPKAWLVVDGQPMAARVAAALLSGGCSPVRFVGSAPDPDLGLGIATVPDHHPGEGPLGGVLTALRVCDADVVVAACDLPAIEPADVRALLIADPSRRAEVVAATALGHHVPLALWRRTALAPVTELFASGARSWREALDALGALEVTIGAAHARDVDTPADLRSIREETLHCDPPDARR
jgi:molybdenum cofactor guanylyltransferase